MDLVISGLYTYPVKSCSGISHDSVSYTRRGLAHDRSWVIVDGDGIFMTQRTVPRMALIQPQLNDSRLSLIAPGMPVIRLSGASSPGEPAAVPVRIFKNDTLGQDEGDEVAEWLSAFLETPCRLLKVHPEADRHANPQLVDAWREQNHEWATDFPSAHVFGFADSFPFLVTSQASLDELNMHLRRKGVDAVPMNRFRPNIVLRGLPAYEEDYLSALSINGALFAFTRPCPRCPIPDIDQATAVKAEEPGLTLAQTRSFPAGVLFGMHAVTDKAGTGTLRLNEPVQAHMAF